MWHEEHDSCATNRIPIKMFCLSWSGVSRSCCWNTENPLICFPLFSLRGRDTDSYHYFLLALEFLNRTDARAGYCIPFFKGRCADSARFPWHCPNVRILVADILYTAQAVWEDSVCGATNSWLSHAPHTAGRPSSLFPFDVLSVLQCIALCVFISHFLNYLPFPFSSVSLSLAPEAIPLLMFEVNISPSFQKTLVLWLTTLWKVIPRAHKQQAPGVDYYSLKALFSVERPVCWFNLMSCLAGGGDQGNSN